MIDHFSAGWIYSWVPEQCYSFAPARFLRTCSKGPGLRSVSLFLAILFIVERNKKEKAHCWPWKPRWYREDPWENNIPRPPRDGNLLHSNAKATGFYWWFLHTRACLHWESIMLFCIIIFDIEGTHHRLCFHCLFLLSISSWSGLICTVNVKLNPPFAHFYPLQCKEAHKTGE